MANRVKLSSKSEYSDDFDDIFSIGSLVIGFGIFLVATGKFWGLILVPSGILIYVLTRRFFKRYKYIEFDECSWYLVTKEKELKFAFSSIQAIKPTYGILDYRTTRNPVRYVYRISFLDEFNRKQ